MVSGALSQHPSCVASGSTGARRAATLLLTSSRTAAELPMASDSGSERKFWQITLVELEMQLAAGRDGLTSGEVASRRVRYGPNSLEERRRLSLPLEFLGRFRNPLVLILLVAAVISALTGDLTSFIIICTIVVTSALLDTVQEYRAKEAAESLKVSVALKEQVLRDGRERTVLGHDLVPGDVALLAAGDLVPRMGVSSRPGIFSSTRRC